MKGQITIPTLLGYLIVFIIYFTFAIPVMSPLIDGFVTDSLASPDEFTPILVSIAQLTPVLLLLAIVASLINSAIPRREGMPGGY